MKEATRPPSSVLGGVRPQLRRQRFPARERELQGRRSAGLALQLEGPSDHAYPLADADEPEAAALRGLGQSALDLEAHSVVDDLELDRASPRAHPDGDVRGARVLADVRERLLDRAKDGDPLGGRERVRVAPNLELGADARALREAVH